MWWKEKQEAEGIDFNEFIFFFFSFAEISGEQNICNDMSGKQTELLFWKVSAGSEVGRCTDLWIISIEVVVKFVF